MTLSRNVFIAGLIFLVFAGLYFFTAAPSLYDGDSGEITANVVSLGVPHPTGFPLYVLLGKAFTLITPFWEPAFGLNVFSAVATALMVALMYRVFLLLGIGNLAAISGAVVLGLGDTIWSHAGAQRVYALTEFLFVLLLWLVIKWDTTKDVKYFYIFAFVWGLSFGNHIMTLLAGFILLSYVVFKNPQFFRQIKAIFTGILLFILPFIQYIYIFLAYFKSEFPSKWGRFNSVSETLAYFSQEQWRSKMGARLEEGTMDLFIKIGKLLTLEFSIVFFLVAIIGFVILYRNKGYVFWSVLGVIVGNVLIELFYGNESDKIVLYRYFFLSYVILSLPIAVGIDHFFKTVKKNSLRILTIVLLFSFSMPSFVSHAKHNNRRDNYIVSDYADNILRSVEPNAILLEAGDSAGGGLEYARALGKRPDLIIVDYNMMTFDWYAKELQEFYPGIFGEDFVKTPPQDRFYYIIDKTFSSKRPLYTTFQVRFPDGVSSKFGVLPVGVAFKIMPVDASADSSIVPKISNLWKEYSLRGIYNKHYKDILIEEFIPLYSLALSFTGIFYMQNNDSMNAEAVFKKALQIDPNNEEAKSYMNLLGTPKE